MTDQLLMTIAILGGTGKEGKGLAYRWARAGYKVVIGSRTPEKAEAAAKELTEMLGDASIEGLDNLSAAKQDAVGNPFGYGDVFQVDADLLQLAQIRPAADQKVGDHGAEVIT